MAHVHARRVGSPLSAVEAPPGRFVVGPDSGLRPEDVRGKCARPEVVLPAGARARRATGKRRGNVGCHGPAVVHDGNAGSGIAGVGCQRYELRSRHVRERARGERLEDARERAAAERAVGAVKARAVHDGGKVGHAIKFAPLLPSGPSELEHRGDCKNVAG